jgi:hypothetical protein
VDDKKGNLLADDVHLISAPVRIVAHWIKILVFIAVLPFVFVVSLADWLLTGTPIMSADEILLTKILLTVLSPFIATIFYVLHKHLRRRKDPEYQHLIPAPIVFVVVLLFILVFVKCNFMFGWAFYK